MGCAIKWSQINTVSRAISSLRKAGFAPTFPGLKVLEKERAKLLAQVGQKFLRITLPIARLPGLSPGVMRVWFDIETGWMAEGRPELKAPPVYHQITAEQAIALLREPPDEKLAHRLLEPDTYLGE